MLHFNCKLFILPNTHPVHSPKANMDVPPGRTCWVCLGEDGDDDNNHWVAPCRCRGSARWVHQACIQKWIDEKQRGCSLITVRCPQCQAKYLIRMPKGSLAWAVYEVADLAVEAASPLIGFGMITSIIYTSALSYGAFAICQFLGRDQGIAFLRSLRTFNICIGVPLIPVLLIFPRLVRPNVTVHRYVEPAENGAHNDSDQLRFNVVEQDVLTLDLVVSTNESMADGVHRMSLSRAIVGGLAFPTIAATVGRICLGSIVKENWRRSALGGIIYLLSKHILRRLWEHNKKRQLKYRVVLNRPVEG